MIDETPKSAGLKLTLFGVATFIWIAVAVYLGASAHNPDTKCVGTFSCLTANEWGDFLAGVFAPIAFLWLVATVWIQSDELREQRKELALTREEFKTNRGVMVEQANEARRQAEFIGLQTRILSEEAESRRQQERLNSFTVLMSRFITHGHESSERIGFRNKDNATMNLIAPLRNRDASERRYIEIQDEHLNDVVNFTLNDPVPIQGHAFRESFSYVYAAEELVPLLPYHSRAAWEMSSLSGVVAKYCMIIDCVSEFADLRPKAKARQARIEAD